MTTPNYRYRGQFRDAAPFDAAEKTCISVRDGAIQYLGQELGMEPPDKLFSVYRSPATIANAAMKMTGLPITADHVSLDIPAPTDGGFVSEAAMVDVLDPSTSTTIAIKNRVALSDTMAANLAAGRNELSLGYTAELIPYQGDEYDFEQVNVDPHHLAAVERGRCGPMCSFLDRAPITQPQQEIQRMATKLKLHKAFCDAEGDMNLQQIVELATALPEAIKSVPVAQLQALVAPLQEIIAAAKSVVPEDKPTVEATDEEVDPEEELKKPAFADAMNRRVMAALDKATGAAVKTHVEVMEKARAFLPTDYKFADKSTAQIMRDALATDTTAQFTDAELPMAFKMMKPPAASYAKFADANPHDFGAIAGKEM